MNTHFFQAIDFFVSAFEFGLLGAMIGVRRMLALIWSQVSKSTLSPLSCPVKIHLEISFRKRPSRTRWWPPTRDSTSTWRVTTAGVPARPSLRISSLLLSVRRRNVLCSVSMLVISGATLGEETSLEKLVSEFVISKDIGKGVFQVRGRNNK